MIVAMVLAVAVVSVVVVRIGLVVVVTNRREKTAKKVFANLPFRT